MPTPSGMFKVGEVIELKSGVAPNIHWKRARVLSRSGSPRDYSVTVEPAEGGTWSNGCLTKIITEVPYHVGRRVIRLAPDKSDIEALARVCNGVEAANPDIEGTRLYKIIDLTLRLAKSEGLVK